MSDGSYRRFLTLEQVAEELNVGLPLVRSLVKSGELRGFQIGGKRLWRVAAGDVEDYVNVAYANTAERIASGATMAEDFEEAPQE